MEKHQGDFKWDDWVERVVETPTFYLKRVENVVLGNNLLEKRKEYDNSVQPEATKRTGDY